MRSKAPLLAILLLLLTSLACSQFTVVNQADRPVSVQVDLPDGTSQLVLLGPEGYSQWFVIEGGPYEVSVVPYESLINYMEDVQASTLSALLTGQVDQAYQRFVGPDFDPISAFHAFLEIERGIDAEQQSGVTCQGELPYTDLETIEFDLAFTGADSVTVALSRPDGTQWACD